MEFSHIFYLQLAMHGFLFDVGLKIHKLSKCKYRKVLGVTKGGVNSPSLLTGFVNKSSILSASLSLQTGLICPKSSIPLTSYMLRSEILYLLSNPSR